jgi:hypothetical protein
MGNNSAPKLVVIAGLTAVLFFFGLLVTERIPEIPVDIDQKPFFIPFLFVALLPMGPPAWAVGLGAALGEGFGDILEGYEPDDAFGFVGYIVCFVVAGYIIRNRPRNWGLVIAACIVGAGIQAVLEASTFLRFGEEALTVAVWSAIGNTITHGVIWGIIPLLILIPLLHGRIERFLGYAPLGMNEEVGEERPETSTQRA